MHLAYISVAPEDNQPLTESIPAAVSSGSSEPIPVVIRDLTRILKIAVQDSSFMKSCSPRQNFAVPVYKHEYLSLIFCQPKKWIFI